jgi:hypothetical protein
MVILFYYENVLCAEIDGVDAIAIVLQIKETLKTIVVANPYSHIQQRQDVPLNPRQG